MEQQKRPLCFNVLESSPGRMVLENKNQQSCTIWFDEKQITIIGHNKKADALMPSLLEFEQCKKGKFDVIKITVDAVDGKRIFYVFGKAFRKMKDILNENEIFKTSKKCTIAINGLEALVGQKNNNDYRKMINELENSDEENINNLSEFENKKEQWKIDAFNSDTDFNDMVSKNSENDADNNHESNNTVVTFNQNKNKKQKISLNRNQANKRNALSFNKKDIIKINYEDFENDAGNILKGYYACPSFKNIETSKKQISLYNKLDNKPDASCII